MARSTLKHPLAPTRRVQEGPKENAPPAGAGSCEAATGAASSAMAPRSLADLGARAAVLRPLSSERARALGVALAEDGEQLGAVASDDGGHGAAEAAAEAAAALTSPPRRALRSLFQE